MKVVCPLERDIQVGLPDSWDEVVVDQDYSPYEIV